MGEWDNVTVHRWVHINIQALFRHQSSHDRLRTRPLGSFPMRIQTDATGTQIWRRIVVQLQREAGPQSRTDKDLLAHLEITSPAGIIWTNRQCLLKIPDIPTGAIHIEARAHFADTQASYRTFIGFLEIYFREFDARYEAFKWVGESTDIDTPSTQPWVPPSLRTSFHSMRGEALPSEPSGSAMEWASFLDSIPGPSSDYHEALIMARRTRPTEAGHQGEGPPSQEAMRSIGWNAFADWATLRQVIQALDCDLGHACPWRKLGIPKLEGSHPSTGNLDLRSRKVLTLLRAGAAAGWTAAGAITYSGAGHHDVGNSLQHGGRSLAGGFYDSVARNRHPSHLHAGTSPTLLQYLDELAISHGPT